VSQGVKEVCNSYTDVLGRDVLATDPENANGKILEAELEQLTTRYSYLSCKVRCCEFTIPLTVW
jgi:hypothetical protein